MGKTAIDCLRRCPIVALTDRIGGDPWRLAVAEARTRIAEHVVSARSFTSSFHQIHPLHVIKVFVQQTQAVIAGWKGAPKLLFGTRYHQSILFVKLLA